MNLKRLDPLYVIALAIAALLILFPPWFKRGGEREFLGFYPVFSPPRYTALRPNTVRTLVDMAKGDPKLLEAIYSTRYQEGQLGYKELAAELLALCVITAAVGAVRRQRRTQANTSD